MRYAVHDRDGWPLANARLQYGGMEARTHAMRFIGWTPQLREKNLPLVVDNPRFLILPWITIPNLGSHILAIDPPPPAPATGPNATARHPRPDRNLPSRPRASPAPLYRASGWTHVGTTQGRGRYDRDTALRSSRRKDVWLRPLRRDWKRTLNR